MNGFAKIIPDSVTRAYGMTTYVYLDIETIPTQDPLLIGAIREGVKPPGNIKKPESIAAWLAEEGQAAGDKAVAATSFDGGRGHVCTVSWAINDDEVQVSHSASVADEAAILSDLFAAFPKYHAFTLVGHNIAGFDLPFLRKRAIVLGIPLPDRFPVNPKPWDASIGDTMTMWAGARDTIGLEALCGVLGIPGKEGFDGSQVATAWAAGGHDKIASYCADDVRRTRAVHQRFLAVGAA